MSATNSPIPLHSSWFTPPGRFANGTLVVLIAAAGIATGWASELIAWARYGAPPTAMRLTYGLLFGSYVSLSAAVVFLVLRRLGGARIFFRSLLPSYALGTLVFIMLRWVGDQWLLPALGGRPNYPPDTGFLSFALDNFTYAALPFFFGALFHLTESQFIGLGQRLQLTHERQLAELDMLRARIAPHFLYNTLNNLYALSMRPGADVSGPLHEMAELMRHVTKRDGQALPLSEEWGLVQRYASLQALRYSDPVNLRLDVDERAMQQPMSALVLLPLMENAFKHGDPCSAEVPLSLVVGIADDRLLVRCENRIGKNVVDDGPSTGLRDLQRLLHLLYNGQAQAVFTPTGDRFIAELNIPLHQHA